VIYHRRKMSLQGKLISEINIKCDGDVFHEIIKYKPHDIFRICSDKIQNMDIHEGELGNIGSVKSWKFTHGKSVLYLVSIFIFVGSFFLFKL